MTSNENKQMNQKGNIVLGVYINCPACAERVIKCLRGYDGVEAVEVDSEKNNVTIKGEKADPVKVAKRLKKRTGKHVDLISPLPQKEKKVQMTVEKKEPKVVEVALKMYLHCEGCAKDVKRFIHKMPGVLTVQSDMEKNLVIVKGTIEPEKLLKFVTKRSGKHVMIVKPEKRNQNEDKKSMEREKICSEKDWYDDFSLDLVHAPQLFSDENPNSCSVM